MNRWVGTWGWAGDRDAANSTLPPLEFDFAGGELGVWLRDARDDDNVEGLDGRNPTWSLSQITSACP